MARRRMRWLDRNIALMQRRVVYLKAMHKWQKVNALYKSLVGRDKERLKLRRWMKGYE